MKKVLSFIICLTLVFNTLGFLALIGTAADTPLFTDAFNYSAFSGNGGIYDASNIWEAEYFSSADDDYGAYDGIAPEVTGGVAVFDKGDALR